MSIELVGLGLEVGDDESFYLDLHKVSAGRPGAYVRVPSRGRGTSRQTLGYDSIYRGS